MQPKIAALWFGVGLAGSIFFFTLAHALWYAPNSDILVPSQSAAVALATSSLPVRLSVPTLNINAKVQYVGVNSKGNLGVPNNFTDVGWYKEGVVPGQAGSAVIDGHVDNGLGLPGVFKNLSNIKKGDDVYVMTQDGSKLDFVVTDVQTYPYQGAPTDLIFSRKGGPRLNLITCEGVWVPKDKTYNKRLVIFTTLRGQ